jgi:hypothetical protein
MKKDWEIGLEKIDARLDRIAAMQEEYDRRCQAEYEKRQAEYEKRQAEYEKWKSEYEKRYEKTERLVKATQTSIFGVSNSNGLVAEQYFFESLEDTKIFGGIHYDDIERNIRQTKKLPDKTKVRGEYDILLSNDTAVCAIEVKYKVCKNDVAELAGRQAANFKILFPEYADYKLYLGIGGMCFEDDVEAKAKELGIGVLKLNGDAVEIDDTALKAY